MLKKRLIGVVTVKNGIAVQSFSYSRYLPLGKPECLVENLDRWGADEILVQVIDRSRYNAGPDFNLIERLGELGLKTPLIYAGGIRSLSDGIEIVQLGADRIIVDSLLHADLATIKSLSERLGAQALIASLPLSWDESRLNWLEYKSKTSKSISDEVIDFIESSAISEVMISDWKNEGKSGGFELKLVENFPLRDVPIITFGGISDLAQMNSLLKYAGVSAVAIGNFLSYREHAIQYLKESMANLSVRNAVYESKFSLLTD